MEAHEVEPAGIEYDIPEPTPQPDAEEGYRFSERLVMLSDNGSIEAESISMLLAHLLSGHVHDYRRGIAFCSATSDTGCSYMAANVATAMALSGTRTLLIDANLKSPEIDEYIVPNEDRGGLLDCLVNNGRSFGDVVHSDVIPGLSVLYSGGESANSATLSSKRFAHVIADCMRDYELTIIDTPPSNQSSAALRIANILRYALVVVRKDKSYVNDVRKLVEDLKDNRAQVLGAYLNEY